MSPMPMTASVTPAQACQAALERVVTTVAIALSLANSGRAVDLAGLDAAAGRVCAQVLDLPPEEGAALRGSLAGLAAKIAVLEGVLKTS